MPNLPRQGREMELKMKVRIKMEKNAMHACLHACIACAGSGESEGVKAIHKKKGRVYKRTS